jgi:hypothetical protein
LRYNNTGSPQKFVNRAADHAGYASEHNKHQPEIEVIAQRAPVQSHERREIERARRAARPLMTRRARHDHDLLPVSLMQMVAAKARTSPKFGARTRPLAFA